MKTISVFTRLLLAIDATFPLNSLISCETTVIPSVVSTAVDWTPRAIDVQIAFRDARLIPWTSCKSDDVLRSMEATMKGHGNLTKMDVNMKVKSAFRIDVPSNLTADAHGFLPEDSFVIIDTEGKRAEYSLRYVLGDESVVQAAVDQLTSLVSTLMSSNGPTSLDLNIRQWELAHDIVPVTSLK